MSPYAKDTKQTKWLTVRRLEAIRSIDQFLIHNQLESE